MNPEKIPYWTWKSESPVDLEFHQNEDLPIYCLHLVIVRKEILVGTLVVHVTGEDVRTSPGDITIMVKETPDSFNFRIGSQKTIVFDASYLTAGGHLTTIKSTIPFNNN